MNTILYISLLFYVVGYWWMIYSLERYFFEDPSPKSFLSYVSFVIVASIVGPLWPLFIFIV